MEARTGKKPQSQTAGSYQDGGEAVKTAKSFVNVERVYFAPEVKACPHCGARLQYAHPVWRKHVITLSKVVYAVNLGYKCPNVACPLHVLVHRSAEAEQLSLKHLSYGIDVLAEVGYLRFQQHGTRREVFEALKERQLAVSEREVQNLYELYLALLKCSHPERLAELRPVMAANGGIVVSLDGIQPERGNETLWVVRDVLTGTTLNAQNLVTSDQASLMELLRPTLALQLPIIGVVSDAQKSIRLAVEALFPGVPHQLCHFHFLRDIAQPTVNTDRALKTDLKKEVRGIKAVEERVKNRTDPEAQVVQGYATALRAVLLEDGLPPLDLPGVRIYEALGAISQSLERCLAKKGRRNFRASCASPNDTSDTGKRTLH